MSLTRRTFIAAACLPGRAAFGQTLGEARVKAKLALTLARFTQWPPASFGAPSDPLLMCVVHATDTLGTAFAELANQSVGGHPVRIVENLAVAGSACHVLFVHDSAQRQGSLALAAVSTLPVMTIGDSEGFAARGGMVELANINDSIRLDVNLRVLRAARLELSSQVLKLARQVRE